MNPYIGLPTYLRNVRPCCDTSPFLDQLSHGQNAIAFPYSFYCWSPCPCLGCFHVTVYVLVNSHNHVNASCRPASYNEIAFLSSHVCPAYIVIPFHRPMHNVVCSYLVCCNYIVYLGPCPVYDMLAFHIVFYDIIVYYHSVHYVMCCIETDFPHSMTQMMQGSVCSPPSMQILSCFILKHYLDF